MVIIVFVVGLVTGCLLSLFIEKISHIVANKENNEKCIKILGLNQLKKHTEFCTRNIIVILISGLLFLISFLQIGLNMIFIQALVLNSILIVISFIDIEHQIIPNKIIIFTLIIGVLF